MKPVVTAIIALTGLLLAGCSTRELIVLLPGKDGKTGELAVSRGGEAVVLDQPLAAARISGFSGVNSSQLEQAEIDREFGDANQAMPKPPTSYVLYFKFGTTELTPDSRDHLQQALVDLEQRPGAEVEVIGHTDRVGKLRDNDRLSIDRARVVKVRLLTHAVDGTLITVSGRGEREPLVATADEAREPKNRRVEIVVR